jgi:Spy/CpxP family protein refolding chaperone
MIYRTAISAITMALLAGAPVIGQNANKPAKESIAPKATVDSGISRQPYGFHFQQIMLRISATPPQRQQIEAIVEAHRPKIAPLREEYRQKSDEFLSLICTGKPAEQVMSSQIQLNQLHNAITNEYYLMRLEIRRLLQPNQWEVFQAYIREQGWDKSANK